MEIYFREGRVKNYHKAKRWAKLEYEERLRTIRIANDIARKAEPLLPNGWECYIPSGVFWLEFRKGDWKDQEKFDPGEFKLVCKIVENIIGKKLVRSASVREETGEIDRLYASNHYHENGVVLWINVNLFGPKFTQSCEITWEEEIHRVAKVSDHCLGLS